MVKNHHKLISVKIITISLIFFNLQGSVSAVEKDSLLNQSIQQSILSRYQQIIIKSYDNLREQFGFQEADKAFRIKHFPVIIENNVANISQQEFHTERFFSHLFSIRNTIKHESKAEPQLISTKTKEKIIRISNFPVKKGFLSSRFGFRKDPFHGSRRMHKGIDISAKYGSPVNPLGKGKVVFAGYKSGYGNTVEIKHGYTVLTRYAHLKRFLVNTGQQVNIDDKIGLIGHSGRSTGPHLHLEVLFNDKQVDPQIFLANHFNSRNNSYQVVKVKPTQKTINKNVTIKVAKISPDNEPKKIAIKKYPQVKKAPQISYNEYVKSVDGLFGFSAPASLPR